MQATVRQFVQTYWRETLEAWRKEVSTKLHFYSQRVLYNAENSGQELGDNVFVLYEDETVKRKKDVNDVVVWSGREAVVGCGYRVCSRAQGLVLQDLEAAVSLQRDRSRWDSRWK